MNDLSQRIAQLYDQQKEIEHQLNKSFMSVYAEISPVDALEKLIAKHEEKDLPAVGMNLLVNQLVDRFLPSKNMFSPFLKQFISNEVVPKLFGKKNVIPEIPLVVPQKKQYRYEQTI